MMMPTLIPAVVQAVQMFLNYYPFIVGKLHIVNCQPTIAAIFGGPLLLLFLRTWRGRSRSTRSSRARY